MTKVLPDDEAVAGHQDWLICEHCDSLYHRVPLVRREVAQCSRCGAVLARGHSLTIEQLLALAITAAVLFLLANAFPVIHIDFEGLSNEASLWESVEALAQGRITLIALVAGLSIILAPGLQIMLLCWLLAHAVQGRVAPGFRLCMRTLEHLRPWSMLEVCLLGAMVSIIKLSGMLNVSPGVGLWAMAMLTVLLVLIAGRDIRRLWNDLGVPAG